jgi:hypothetical protein
VGASQDFQVRLDAAGRYRHRLADLMPRRELTSLSTSWPKGAERQERAV